MGGRVAIPPVTTSNSSVVSSTDFSLACSILLLPSLFRCIISSVTWTMTDQQRPRCSPGNSVPVLHQAFSQLWDRDAVVASNLSNGELQ